MTNLVQFITYLRFKLIWKISFELSLKKFEKGNSKIEVGVAKKIQNECEKDCFELKNWNRILLQKYIHHILWHTSKIWVSFPQFHLVKSPSNYSSMSFFQGCKPPLFHCSLTPNKRRFIHETKVRSAISSTQRYCIKGH